MTHYRHASNNLIGLNAFLFNWPVPFLLFVFVGLMIFRPKASATTLMLSSWLALTAAYVPYFFQDWCVGPRYQHEITGYLLVLTAVGIVRTPATLRAVGCRMPRSRIRRYLAGAVGALYLGATFLWLAVLPRGLSQCKPPPVSAAEFDATIPDHSLVFANRSYSARTVFLPPLPGNRVIYARDLGAKNELLISYYPDRTAYLETPDGFRRIRGPVEPESGS